GATHRAGRARVLCYNSFRHPASGRRAGARKRGFAKGKHCLAIVAALPGKLSPRPQSRAKPGSDTRLSLPTIHLLPAQTPWRDLPLPVRLVGYLHFGQASCTNASFGAVRASTMREHTRARATRTRARG